MIAGIFHQGSGLGNQLFRYIAVRTLAEDKGYEWGMSYVPDGSGKEEGFKGSSFMKIDLGKNPSEHKFDSVFNEKKIVENGVDIRGYDPEINFVQDDTVVDGEFQDERYWGHRLNDIDKWIDVTPIGVANDCCVIGFRGGEYAVYPDLFLTKEYWDIAISEMRKINKDMDFHVVTDDMPLAKQFFPEFCVTHDIGMDWKKIRYARYSIISNSSFYIIPRLLKHNHDDKSVTIAPRYWARRNIGVWALPQNYYSAFRYV